MATGDSTGTRTVPIFSTDHILQSRRWIITCRVSFSHRALELLTGIYSTFVHEFSSLGFWYLWSDAVNCGYLQHKVRLGKYKRDSESLQKEGENFQAVWSPDTKLITVIVSFRLITLPVLVIFVIS